MGALIVHYFKTPVAMSTRRRELTVVSSMLSLRARADRLLQRLRASLMGVDSLTPTVLILACNEATLSQCITSFDPLLSSSRQLSWWLHLLFLALCCRSEVYAPDLGGTK